MLLRNTDQVRGHCNGTRYIVRQISQQYITGQRACREYSGNVLLIPRIPLSPTDARLPFTRVDGSFLYDQHFAMTINKAQGEKYSEYIQRVLEKNCNPTPFPIKYWVIQKKTQCARSAADKARKKSYHAAPQVTATAVQRQE